MKPYFSDFFTTKIRKNREEDKMNKEAVLERVRKELEMPLFNGTIENKEYTEAEYQELKKSLVQYFDDYVRNVEN